MPQLVRSQQLKKLTICVDQLGSTSQETSRIRRAGYVCCLERRGNIVSIGDHKSTLGW